MNTPNKLTVARMIIVPFLVGVADQQDAVGQIVGRKGREVGLLVARGVNRVVVVKPRSRGVFLTGGKHRAQQQPDGEVSEDFCTHNVMVLV